MHRRSIRVSKRDLVTAARFQLQAMRPQPFPACPDGDNLPRKVGIMRCPGSRLSRTRTIQLFKKTLMPFVTSPQFTLKLGRCEVPVAAVHRLDRGAIHSQKFPAMKVKLPAEVNEFTEHLPEGSHVGAPEVSNGPEVRTQPAQQPDHLKIALSFRFQPTA